MCKTKLCVLLHKVGINTNAYDGLVIDIQDELDANWLQRMKKDPSYLKYKLKCKTRYYDFTGEFDMAIRNYHITPREAYLWVDEEFMCK